MKGTPIDSIPTRASSTAFEGLYDEISRDWQRKAEALQIRRWQKLRHESRGSAY